MPKCNKVEKKRLLYLHMCNRFMKMFIISMIFGKQLRICDGKLFHKSDNVVMMSTMIYRKYQLQVYVMAGMARSLMLRLMGTTRACNHHSHHPHHPPLMMRMMNMIIRRISTVTISCLDVVHSHPSLEYGGAATAHMPKSTQFLCSIRVLPGEKVSSMEVPLRIKVPDAISFGDNVVSGNTVGAVVSFRTPEDAEKAKNLLKTCEIVVTDTKGKECKRNPCVEIVKQKRSDPKSDLPEFNVWRLDGLISQGIPMRPEHEPTWLRDSVIFSGIFRVSGGGIFLDKPVSNTRPAKCYTRPSCTSDYRIAHPDHIGIRNKCTEMCTKNGSSFEYGWTFICEVDIPVPILQCPKFWHGGRSFKDA